jgi:hypothetical protein
LFALVDRLLAILNLTIILGLRLLLGIGILLMLFGYFYLQQFMFGAHINKYFN